MEERITELEILVAHQDDTIRSLNEELVRQRRALDRLTRHMQTLEKMVKQSADSDSPAPEDEPPPPHY